MPVFPDEARAEEGRPIPPAWRALERWVDNYEVPTGGPNYRVRVWPDQVDFFARRKPASWRHPFRVSVAGTKAFVSPGLLNLEIPRMGEENLTLDGLDETGKESGRIPELDLAGPEHGGPGKDGRSFICLRVVVNPETGEPSLEEKPAEWLSVVHRPELPRGYHAGGMPTVDEGGAEVGLWPLSILYWNPEGTLVRRFFHSSHHNLQFRFQAGAVTDEATGARGPNRAWFFGIT